MDPKAHPEVRYMGDVMPRFQAMVAEERRNGAMLDAAGLMTLYSDAAWSLPNVRAAMQDDLSAKPAPKEEPKTVKKTVKKVSSSASSGSGSASHSEDLPDTMSVRESVERANAQLLRQGGAL